MEEGLDRPLCRDRAGGTSRGSDPNIVEADALAQTNSKFVLYCFARFSIIAGARFLVAPNLAVGIIVRQGNVLQKKDIRWPLRLGYFPGHVRDLKANYADSIVNTLFRKKTILRFAMESAIHGLFREPDCGSGKLAINKLVTEIAKI
jgi:hypothetical protein